MTTVEWIGASATSTALRESLWAYPAIETIHVLGICLFAGLAALLDLRLLGVALRGTAVSEIFERVMPWTWAGFAVMVVSGLLLLCADPVRFLGNAFFQAKLALLALAGANAGLFHATVYRGVWAWDLSSPPLSARVAGGVSLCAWSAVIVTGRLIAYNWR